MPPRVVSLRRCPVKSMGGEDLDRVELDQASRIPRCRMIDIAQDGVAPRHRTR